MWRAFIVIAALLLGAPPADAAFWIGQTYTVAAVAGGVVPQGAGGNVIGESQANDGTMVMRIDVYGAYIWNATASSPAGTETGAWQQLITSSSMPAIFTSNFQALGDGVSAIQLAPKNSQIAYMVYNTYANGVNPPYQTVYKSTNATCESSGQSCATWTATGFSPLNFDLDFGGDGSPIPYKAWGPKLSIDPTDATAQTVYAGSGEGLFETTNGGTGWSAISTSNVALTWSDNGMNTSGQTTLTGGATGVAATGTMNFQVNPSSGYSITLGNVGVGFVNVSAWASGTTYSMNQEVYGSDNHVYTSLSNGNIGNDPVTDGGAHWQDSNGTQIQIQGSLSSTLSLAATILNASTNSTIDLSTYSATSTTLAITYATTGTTGNSFVIGVSGNFPGYVVVMSGFTAGDVIVYSYGNGVYLYHSGSWSQIANSGTCSGSTCPVAIVRADIDPVTGIYYGVDRLGNAWKYVIGTGWTEIYIKGAGASAIDLAVDHDIASGAADNHIVLGDGNGHLNETTNAGSSFGGWTLACNPCSSTNDVTWLDIFATNDQVLLFDRVTAKKLYAATNRAVWAWTYSGSLSGSSTAQWVSQSRGSEALVTNGLLVNASAAPYTYVWDSGTFGPLSLSSYPASQAFPNSSPANIYVIATWGMAQCTSDSTKLVANSDGSYAGFEQYSGYYNGSWSNFASYPSNLGTNGDKGSVACNDPNHVLFAPDSIAPSYTTNGGSSWTAITISGISDWTKFQQNNQGGGIAVASDRGGGSSTYYLFFNQTGFFDSTNNGSSWSSLDSYTQSQSPGAQIKTPIGQTGDFWFVGGQNQGGDQQMPCGLSPLFHYYSGTVNTISNITCPYSVGFGYNSGGYPSVFTLGWYVDSSSSTLTISGTGTQTLTVSTNNAAYTVPSTCSATPSTCQPVILSSSGHFDATGYIQSYTPSTGSMTVNITSVLQSGTNSGAFSVEPWGLFESDNASTGTSPTWTVKTVFPCSSLDLVHDVEGDPAIHGRWYVSFSGSGACYGSYLLNRDLDPASNDNSPVGLAKVG